MKKVTIFTPTYNRGELLSQLYNSLLEQTYKNFEWLIIDDGSNDSTKNIVENFIKEEKICIKYIYQENGGKHRAINKGIDIAKGELFFIVDSDDYLTNDALEKIINYEKKIKENNLAGVCGLVGKNETTMVGTTFSGVEKELYNYEREKYNITGDKAEVFYTSILKKYKFPEYDNEKFLNESIVWNNLAFDGYKLKYFNEIIYICDYLQDGLSKNIINHLKNSPKGFLEYIKQLLKIHKKSFIQKIKLVSYYYEVVQDLYNDTEIAYQLGISKLFLKFSWFVRKLFKVRS